jgi:hypothetical protein
VEIDRLVPWDVLRGADRLSQALVEQLARGERALPLSPRWLSENLGLWDTDKAAKRWLEDSPEIKDLFRMINDLQNKKPRPSNKDFLLGKRGFLPPQVLDQLEKAGGINDFAMVEYRPKRQKSWSQALVWDADPRQALAHALEMPERELIVRRPHSFDTDAMKDCA